MAELDDAEEVSEETLDIVDDAEEAELDADAEEVIDADAELLEDELADAAEAEAEDEGADELTDGPAATEEKEDVPLVAGYSNFSSKFSPFFAESAYDQDAQWFTQLELFQLDRTGAVVYNGIEGETIPYNGTDYTYYGPADIVVTENEDGTVYYDVTMRDDLVFSDGEPMTIDDVIFSMYVVCDPTYDGSHTLFSQPIEGMAEYRSGMDTLFNLLVAAGRDNTDYTYWTEEEQTAFWADLDQAGAAFAQEIVDFCKGAGYNAEEDSLAACAANWGYELADDATAEDFWNAMVEAYEGDIATLSATETAATPIYDFMENGEDYKTRGIETGESAPSITGIQKTGDYSLRIVATQVDATLIYQLPVAIAPLHYYGDPELYDYDNNSFGFPKGDLSLVRAKTTQPLGAGPYKFVKYENGVVNYEANENYFLGEPKTKYLNLREVTDQDKLNGVLTGTIDVTDPSFDTECVDAITQANGGELDGEMVTTSTVDNLGYGYIGMNTHNMSVDSDPSSDESKNLRRAFATILSVYRDVAIDTYYGERASVINYPISNTSWAAPQPTDDDYEIAFSTDVNGEPIYTSGMSDEEKYAAAKEAALGFFEAAGYTVEDGKLTAAPVGAKLEYEVQIPADGVGDHPAFMILTLAKDALAEIGMNLIVTDLSNSADLWTSLEAHQVDMWCAAWGATVDPDMYQIYYSDTANGGKEPGGSNYMYQIEDEELDEMILMARESTDQEYRKAMYKACLDTVIDWACEIPCYQRQNAVIFSTERVNMDTMTPDITTFYNWYREIYNIELN
ncbi:MAG: ABC transporter substrate-binding protein [Blautia sp.]|nr:ABC transporter substrate-binding protein [Blautia sp.]